MEAFGFALFQRAYLVEGQRRALIIDVRGNPGGRVSELVLEKLLKRRAAYSVPRWGAPTPYPTVRAPHV
jgi:tricorn protease